MMKSHPISRRAGWWALLLWLAPVCLRAENQSTAIIAVGAPGEPAYAEVFAKWAATWQKACAAGGVHTTLIDAKTTDATAYEQLEKAIAAAPKDGDPLWLVLLGHGTFDTRIGKFNLPGDDLSADELATWLKPFQRIVIIVAGFSSSGAWLKPLAAPGRVVITATKSGTENNFSRFGGYLGDAFAAGADLDKDGETSLLEAWLAAARRTADFYSSEGRIATEHSLLDDNADALGTPADWFVGVRAVKKPQGKAAVDGQRAAQLTLVPSATERALTPKQRETRDSLERELAALRAKKETMPEADYLAELEKILLQLAQVYHDSGS